MLFLILRIYHNILSKLSLSQNVFHRKDSKKATGHV